MGREPIIILIRRFVDRIWESGLLIIAIALGVGAAAASLSLVANTQKWGQTLLSSPEYRELVVSNRDKAEDMTVPGVKKTVKDAKALTQSDLKAAELAPDVSYAYISNQREMRFVNQSSAARMANMPQPPGGIAASGRTGSGNGSQNNPPAPPEGAPRLMSAEELAKAQAQADVVIVEQEEVKGYSVTPEYFQAWGIEAAKGSLFTADDVTGDKSLVVLGSTLAKTIAGEGKNTGDLVGKKLLAWQGYQIVVGIAAPTGRETIDQAYFAPYRADRFWNNNTRLKFAVSNPETLNRTQELLSQWFSQKFGDGVLTFSNPRAEVQKIIARNTGIGVLVLFLALAALFIALVNVSNILLGRGLRARRNLGILMALGASRKSILELFGLEALFMAFAGSLLGIAFALPLSQTMESALGLGNQGGGELLWGTLGALLVTLVFSLAPAWQNAKLNPADSMRTGA